MTCQKNMNSTCCLPNFAFIENNKKYINTLKKKKTLSIKELTESSKRIHVANLNLSVKDSLATLKFGIKTYYFCSSI